MEKILIRALLCFAFAYALAATGCRLDDVSIRPTQKGNGSAEHTGYLCDYRGKEIRCDQTDAKKCLEWCREVLLR